MIIHVAIRVKLAIPLMAAFDIMAQEENLRLLRGQQQFWKLETHFQLCFFQSFLFAGCK